MPAYKIASADLINTPLLRHVAEIGKPMILSTGGATLDDVRRGYETVAEINPQIALLQCTAGYPAEWDELDLRVIATYRECFPDRRRGPLEPRQRDRDGGRRLRARRPDRSRSTSRSTAR